MKVLTVFPWLQNFSRYVPQMRAIAERVDEFHIAYASGLPKKEWTETFTFHRFMRLHPNYGYNKAWTQAIRFARSIYTLYLLGRAIRGINRLCKINVDLYYMLSGYFPMDIAVRLAESQRKPLVVRLRGNFEEEIGKTQTLLTRGFDLRRALQKLRKADLVIPITSKLHDWGLRCGITNISDPVTLGVDTEMFSPNGHKPEQFTVGYSGRLTPEKGVDRLINLIQQLPDVQFNLAGRVQCHLPRKKNIHYFGWIPYELMPSFYNTVDVLALPSYTEGFPNVILEAYASGKPVVATHEAFPEELKVYGVVGDIEEFPSMIQELRDSNPQKLGKKARAYVTKEYGWNRFGERMVAEIARCN